MIRSLVALALALWAGAADSQIVTDAAGLREISARLLAQGEPAPARDLAEALLRQDPDDVAALLLLAQAELALGRPDDALAPARRAHGLAEGTARFNAARLVALAHFEAGNYTWAQLWLRRARGDAPDDAALAQLSRDFRTVRARNPLTVGLTFGIAPSSNVNGGSREDTVLFPGTPFEVPLSPDAQALSGLRISGGVTLAYRFRQDRRSATSFEVQGQGRTYVLSSEARDQAPDSEGSDFSDVALTTGIVHRWRGEGDSGPSSVRLTYGRTLYGGDPYTGFVQVGFDRGFALTESDRLDLSLFGDWTERRTVVERIGEQPNGDKILVEDEVFDEYASVGVRGRWTHRLESGDRTNLSLSVRQGLDDLPDTSYDGVTLGIGYDWARPIRGVRLGVGAELDWRRYDVSNFSFQERNDVRGSLRATMGLPRYDVWGFEPTVGVEASRTDSDASNRFDKNALSVDFGFRSSF